VIMPVPVRQKQAEKKKFKQPQSSLIDSTSRAFSVILVAFDDNRSVAVTTNKYVCAQHLALINASSTFALQEFLMTLQDHEVSSHTLYLEGDFPGTYLSFKLVQSRLLEYLAAHCHGEIMAFISMNVLPLHVFTPVTISDREADARVVSTFMISEFANATAATICLSGHDTKLSAILPVVNHFVRNTSRMHPSMPRLVNRHPQSTSAQYIQYVFQTILHWRFGSNPNISSITVLIVHLFEIVKSMYVNMSKQLDHVINISSTIEFVKKNHIFGGTKYLYVA